MIIYFGPGGRMGNLMFQVAFLLKQRKPGERIFTFNMGATRRFQKLPTRWYDGSSAFLAGLVKWILRPVVIHLFVRTRIISSAIENEAGLHYKNGALRGIKFYQGYFQNEKVEQRVLPEMRLHRSILRRVETTSRRPPGSVVFFVHIRRTDYANFRVLGQTNPTLPDQYYERSIRELMQRYPDAHFSFFSDDVEHVRQTFAWVPRKEFFAGTPEEDFAAMTLCDGGILSNSTFSWWAGFLSRRNAPVLAPEFWLGWKQRIWYPVNLDLGFAEIRQVAEH